MEKQENIDKKARTIQEVVNSLGWTSDISALVKRINEMDNGLIQEDEFAYILNWSNKCSIVHKLDQFHIPPSSKELYTIPDLLAIFDKNGEKLKYFIEVKTSKDNKLSWTEKYYQGLINYSNDTGIPILIAWKWNLFSIWTLFELEHFEKAVTNYKINFEKANQESLMSKLVGDYFIILPEEMGLHFKFKKDILEKKREIAAPEKMILESIYITGKDNKEITKFSVEIFALLFSLFMDETTKETKTHLIQSFTPLNKTIFAQSVIVRLAKVFDKSNITWHEKIKEQNFPIKYEELLKSLTEEIKNGIIESIFFILPLSEKQD